MDEYELNEKDIDSAIRWLKLNDPKNATPEGAFRLLEQMQEMAHSAGHVLDEDALLRAQQELKRKKR